MEKINFLLFSFLKRQMRQLQNCHEWTLTISEEEKGSSLRERSARNAQGVTWIGNSSEIQGPWWLMLDNGELRGYSKSEYRGGITCWSRKLCYPTTKAKLKFQDQNLPI